LKRLINMQGNTIFTNVTLHKVSKFMLQHAHSLVDWSWFAIIIQFIIWFLVGYIFVCNFAPLYDQFLRNFDQIRN